MEQHRLLEVSYLLFDTMLSPNKRKEPQTWGACKAREGTEAKAQWQEMPGQNGWASPQQQRCDQNLPSGRGPAAGFWWCYWPGWHPALHPGRAEGCRGGVLPFLYHIQLWAGRQTIKVGYEKRGAGSSPRPSIIAPDNMCCRVLTGVNLRKNITE